ncbi:hypothetical protein BSIN_2981 [Burkholderia singularis]|uniref:Uncharacterized protein n=1 Tax=Burkholderia singularis TaxID=1503053 RepID=A0A238H3U1_9BURK|nr:hypothetical protein BSIN_2981 [Burkholderia singularis]
MRLSSGPVGAGALDARQRLRAVRTVAPPKRKTKIEGDDRWPISTT